MNCCRSLAVVSMVAVLMCSVVSGQDDAPAGRRGRGGQQPDPAAQARMVRLSLLGMSEVQQALGLDEEAVEKLTEELKTAMPARGGRGGQAQDSVSPEDRDAAAETIHKMLTDKQHARLTGIVVQALAGRALQDKEVAAAVKITEEQGSEIQKVFADSQQEMRSAMQELMSGGQPDRAAMQEAMADINRDASAAAMKVLTEEQKEAFEKLKGEKVELPETAGRLLMGGRGGRGGQGGGQRGGGGNGDNE